MTSGFLPRQDLVELARRLIEDFNDQPYGHVEVLADRMSSVVHGPVVHALAQHCMRLGRVALDLYEAGLTVEAMPTVRSIYETALTTQWLSLSRESIFGFSNKDLRSRRALSRTMSKAAGEVFREGAGSIAHLDDPEIDSIATQVARTFENICDSLHGGGADAYVTYRVLSSYSHPSSVLAEHYLDDQDGATLPALLFTPKPFDHEAWLHLTAASLVWAGSAFDQMTKHRPYEGLLAETASKLGIPATLRLTEQARIADFNASRDRRHSKWKGPRGRTRRAPADDM